VRATDWDVPCAWSAGKKTCSSCCCIRLAFTTLLERCGHHTTPGTTASQPHFVGLDCPPPAAVIRQPWGCGRHPSCDKRLQ
jgi:hypothetical protein